MRSRSHIIGLVSIVFAALTAGSAAAAAPQQLTATLAGNLGPSPIPLSRVSDFHCHDAAAPTIRCFHGAAARDRDLSATLTSSRAPGHRPGLVAMSVLPYVTFYEHENYGGASFTASSAIPYLGTLGWNDAITSFRSLNGGHPKWWSDANYTNSAWQWAAASWVANVGSGANDKFSSVKDVP